MNEQILTKCRRLIMESGVRQDELAPLLLLDRSRLSRVLNGRDRMPDDFEARLQAAIIQAVDEKRRRAYAAVAREVAP